MDQRSLKQPKGLPQGIYFDLPDKDYHADPALSHSGIVKMLIHHYDYWRSSPLNKNKPPFEPSDAMKFGTRCHMYLLQPDKFFDHYRTIQCNYRQNIHKELITDKDFRDIKESIRMLKPTTAKYITDGYPEVSIFWLDPATGIKHKIRIDYLRTFGGIDYKRCKDIQLSKLGWHILDYGYDIQNNLYIQGIKQIKQLIRAGAPIMISGEHDPKWLKRFANDADTEFKFIFQRSTPPFVYENVDFDDEVSANAEVAINDAKERYLSCLDRFGSDVEWPAGEDQTSTMTLYHMPRRILDRGARPIN